MILVTRDLIEIAPGWPPPPSPPPGWPPPPPCPGHINGSIWIWNIKYRDSYLANWHGDEERSFSSSISCLRITGSGSGGISSFLPDLLHGGADAFTDLHLPDSRCLVTAYESFRDLPQSGHSKVISCPHHLPRAWPPSGRSWPHRAGPLLWPQSGGFSQPWGWLPGHAWWSLAWSFQGAGPDLSACWPQEETGVDLHLPDSRCLVTAYESFRDLPQSGHSKVISRTHYQDLKNICQRNTLSYHYSTSLNKDDYDLILTEQELAVCDITSVREMCFLTSLNKDDSGLDFLGKTPKGKNPDSQLGHQVPDPCLWNPL